VYLSITSDIQHSSMVLPSLARQSFY